MAALPKDEKKKLIVFVAIATSALAIILAANVTVHERSLSMLEGAGTPLRAGLERLRANPTACGMTMQSSPQNERPMRHVNATLIDLPDVLALGRSDADHMSSTFFRPDVKFYNGFLSNTCFAYQYEVFYDLMNAHHGVPKLVLLDVGTDFILREGTEPMWDSPADNPKWYGNPPFRWGKKAPPPWYRDIPSLLSLAQTGETLAWLGAKLQSPAKHDKDVATVDTGEPFRCVATSVPANMTRWLSDGSRVYEGEVNAVAPPPGPLRINNAVGDRHPNMERLEGLDFIVRKIEEAGTKVILYSSPVHPRSFEDPKQAKALAAFDVAVSEVAKRHGVDFCDFATKAKEIGCSLADFRDELHILRPCDRRIVREMTRGCAPRAGPTLKAMLAPEVLQ